jgi:predicted PurR-regulated permease PerM
MKEPIHIRLPLYAKVALILISLALIVVTLKLGHGILVPLAFAFLFAMLLHPLCVRLEALKVPRILAIFTCLIAIMLAIGLILYFITAQIMRFSQDIPELQARFNEIVNELQNYVDDTFGIARSNQASLFRQSVDQLVQSSGTILTGTLAATTHIYLLLPVLPDILQAVFI